MRIVDRLILSKIITMTKFSCQWMNEDIQNLRRKKLYRHRRAVKTQKPRD